MLYYLSQWLLDKSAGTAWADHLSALRLFKYITFRCAGAAVTALLLSWWLGPKVILWLKRLKFGQEYADKGRHFDRPDAQSGHTFVGEGEYARATDVAFGGSADRLGILRRLRENH